MAFPQTRRSVVLAVRSADPEERARALDVLVAAYWRPVFRHVRGRWREDEEDARDLAQGFFAAALEKGWLARFDPARGKFRTYLLTCLDGYVAKERRAGRRLKRGGRRHVRAARGDRRGRRDAGSCPSRTAPTSRPSSSGSGRGASSRSRSSRSAARCAGTGKAVAFALFERYDIEGAEAADRPSYAAARRRARPAGHPGHEPPALGEAGAAGGRARQAPRDHGQRGGVPRGGAGPPRGGGPVKELGDRALDHLREVAQRPDLSGTRYELGRGAGSRRDGRRLRRARPRARARGGAQGRGGRDGRPGDGRPAAARGADHRPPRAPRHRARARRGDAPRRPGLLRDEARDAGSGSTRMVARGRRRSASGSGSSCGSASRSPSPTPTASSTAT